jgi:endo-1,4-beta-xylanase
MMRLPRTLWLMTLAAGAACAQSAEYLRLWNDPEVRQRIDAGIRANRMGWATVEFRDAADRGVGDVEVRLELVRHDFLFGCNIFLLGGYPEAGKNRAYEERFLQLFNYASAPFYWSDLEPEQGQPRFDVSSKPVYRRPPPDAVLAFTEQHGLRVKGHPLIWHQWLPDWLPGDASGVERLARKRIGEIAARYGKRIDFWDVVNEPLERPPQAVLPRDYVWWTFQEADRAFPTGSTLILNEVTNHWSGFHQEDSAFYLLIDRLRRRGARLGALGFQFHLFSEALHRDVLGGKALRPLDMYAVLDRYADFQLPIHITEITIPTLPDDAAGRAGQAELVRNFYRLWFSHPQVEAITWWNLSDGSAVPTEIRWHGGLLDEAMQPKPSFDALEQLIHGEWQTRLTTRSDEPTLRFQGFYGAYRITASHAGKTVTETVHLSKGGANRYVVRMR